MRVRAAVQHGERRVVVEELTLPERTGDDMAVLAVEANGMCGSDWEQYRGGLGISNLVRLPMVPGHETVGRIHDIGSRAAQRMKVGAGARVALNSVVACGTCRDCLAGRRLFCAERFIYGYAPLSIAPGLWGGYAEYVVLRPNTVVYPLPESVSAEDAVLFNPLAGGFDWLCRAGGVSVGDSVLIIGAGQRGLCAIVAAVEAGAAHIILAGRGRHRWKLELARDLGATDVIDMEREDVVSTVREITGGDMVDCALDTVPNATEPVRIAVDSVRAEGTVVLGGIKGGVSGVDGLTPDTLCARGITARGVFGVSDWSKQEAVRVIAAQRHPALHRLHTHTFALDQIDHALRVMGGEVDGEEALHVTVRCG
jgi:threonine dehydrogenase-like Zn-dependent dehydrogenase